MENLAGIISATGRTPHTRTGASDEAASEKLLRLKADGENAREGLLGGIDCPTCRNKGYIVKIADGQIYTSECDCMKNRRTIWRAKRAGLLDMVKRYSFKNFLTTEPWQKDMKAAAEKYLKEGAGQWMYVSGTPGSGKTHLCVATVSHLLKNVGAEARYFLWRTDAPRLKAMVNDSRAEYEKLMYDYATVDVLYIDDFFKGTVTDADVNLAFELLNARYNNTRLRTIISSELSISRILDIDEGLGSRIYERSRDFDLRMPEKNLRLAKR